MRKKREFFMIGLMMLYGILFSATGQVLSHAKQNSHPNPSSSISTNEDAMMKDFSFTDNQLYILFDRNATPTITTLDKPFRVVLDFPNAVFSDSFYEKYHFSRDGGAQGTYTVSDHPSVQRTRFAMFNHASQTVQTVRFVIDVNEAMYGQMIRQDKGAITISLMPGGSRNQNDVATKKRSVSGQSRSLETGSTVSGSSSETIPTTVSGSSSDRTIPTISGSSSDGTIPTISGSSSDGTIPTISGSSSDGTVSTLSGDSSGTASSAISGNSSGEGNNYNGVGNNAHLLVKPEGKYTILLDPGHGGTDPGARSVSGKHEKDFTLALALKVRDLLLQEDKIHTVMTKEDDSFVKLQDRSAMANTLLADLFLSIHGNSVPNRPAASGAETYYYHADKRGFADTIHKHLLMGTQFKDRGVKWGNFHVVRETKMPSALLEVGFLTNAEEEAQLFDEQFQQRVAQNIVNGIKEYVDALDMEKRNDFDNLSIMQPQNEQ